MTNIEKTLDDIVGKLTTIQRSQDDLRKDFKREMTALREQIDELKDDTAIQAGEIASNKKKSVELPMKSPVAFMQSYAD